MISGCHLCVAEDRTCVLVSSAKVLSPARNAFIASDERVHLQCEIIFGLVFGGECSRDYLVARDERVRLQCDIVFRGDPGFPRLARERVYTNYHY